MVVVAAARDEDRLRPAGHEVEAEALEVEAARRVEVVGLEVDVPDAGAGGEAVRALAGGEQPLRIERECGHLQAAVAVPGVPRSVGVELEAVPVRIVEV